MYYHCVGRGAGGRGQGAGGKITMSALGNWIIYFLEVPKQGRQERKEVYFSVILLSCCLPDLTKKFLTLTPPHPYTLTPLNPEFLDFLIFYLELSPSSYGNSMINLCSATQSNTDPIF
ncbi:hypothetical protein CLI64_10530 [Nostoc sp. CENA543]|nr:hypothetical protein CLI64_10530 [Nostoc sp. CENA543]